MKRILRSALSVLTAVAVICAAAVGAVWLVVAQPSTQKNAPSKIRVLADRLERHVRALSEEFHPRDYTHPENLDRAAAYILAHFKDAGAREASYQEFSVMGKTYRNVVARFGPKGEERIVVGAHYDAFTGTPGADDNASGVAGLIELGYLLGKEPAGRDVELVAYVLEEPPFFATDQMGSARHAEGLSGEGVKVKLMISLEMIGYFTDEEKSQDFPMPLLKLIYPGRGDYIVLVSGLDQRQITKEVKAAMRGATDLPVHSINAPALIAGVDFSDHRNYWQNGYQALMVTDTSFYRNKAYHKEIDTADRLDYGKMAKVVVGVYEAVRKLAEPEK